MVLLTAKTLVGDATVSEQNQILGHHSIRIFEEFYKSDDVTYDTQSAFMGTPSKSALLSTANRMGTFVDKRRPWKLDEVDRHELRSDKALQKVREIQDTAKAECTEKFGTLAKAKDQNFELWRRYQEAKNSCRRLFQRRERRMVDDKRQHFDQTQPTRDVQCLLQGLPIDSQPSKPEYVRVSVRQRRDIATELFTEPGYSVGTSEETQRRITLLASLTALSREWESFYQMKCADTKSPAPSRSDEGVWTQYLPLTVSEESNIGTASPLVPVQQTEFLVSGKCLTQPDKDTETGRGVEMMPWSNSTPENYGEEVHREDGPNCSMAPGEVMQFGPQALDEVDEVFKWAVDWEAGNSKDAVEPTRLTFNVCIFCHFSGKSARFSRKEHMQRHAQARHFRSLKAGNVPACPDPACEQRQFVNLKAFKNHVAIVHDVVFAA
jgi:hypothetical protein